MGIFYAKVSVANLAGGDAHETEALVDTGATDSAFPAALLEALHIRAEESVTYVTADGSEIECEYGYARFTIALDDDQSVSGVAPVAFWPDESGQCIGATTLQSLKLAVDTPDERLVQVRMGRRGWAGRLERG
ncbi:MAG: aspartyl protease family protein [Chloroflexi bacterium]|nr:aspartyl protease family protein [Chloroflexota bacterium]